MKSICTIILFFFIPYLIFAQSNENKGLHVGVNIGLYIADNKTSSLYDGKLDKDANILEIFQSPIVYQQISEQFNTDFELYEYPIVKYIPTIQLGGLLQFVINDDFNIFSNLNFTKLQSEGTFLILLNSTNSDGFGQNTEEGYVTGKESRLDISLGAHKYLNTQSNTPFYRIAPIASFVSIEEHQLTIDNYTSSFYYSSSQDNSLHSYWGYGLNLDLGMRFLVKKHMLLSYIGIDAIKYQSFNKLTLQKKLSISILL